MLVVHLYLLLNSLLLHLSILNLIMLLLDLAYLLDLMVLSLQFLLDQLVNKLDLASCLPPILVMEIQSVTIRVLESTLSVLAM
ncbi:hypothetical protein EDC94DRAFT_614512 [Helicostylum pulchrum]|nr:hypothetical protein EDC94DRAFT_614512 [Helicostylum pulchrum]